MPYLFDKYYLMLVVPAFIFALYAQIRVKSTFAKYSKYPNSRRLTGSEVARDILDMNGLKDVRVERIQGDLNDHYDPRQRVLRLSDSVYSSASVAAIGVAAHEAGHAIQHKTGYVPLAFRNSIVPVANLGSGIGPWLAILGLVFRWGFLFELGIILFIAAVAFTLITLPVEFNASSRAIRTLEHSGLLTADEIPRARKVLSAAAMTYVAAAAVAVANLLRLILLSRRNN